MTVNRWLLPEGVEEMLPPAAWRLESARRRLLDLYHCWGFDLVRPPLIEYLDSLLTGAGHNLDLQTFKLTDQLSGRMMGVRSDMTTQTARIDAHRLPVEPPARYCYVGSVLRTRPEEPGGSRSPLQLGAELFGHAGEEGDLEVLSLMIETLRACGIDNAYLDLGHVGIYRALVDHHGVNGAIEGDLFDIMQRKSVPDLDALIAENALTARAGEHFRRLIGLNGTAEVLDEAEAVLGDVDERIGQALATLRHVVGRLQRDYADLPLYLDLAELRGYRYKTGVVFAAFAPGLGRELARGGRYDNVGAAFGRARPATGFSADLNVLVALGRMAPPAETASVFAPADDDEALSQAVHALRAEGVRVVRALPGAPGSAEDFGCEEELVRGESGWERRPVQGS